MFDFGWDEMALIAVVSLIVIGPKDLPKVLRQAGRWTRKARAMAAEFQHGLDEMMRESELKDLKSQVETVVDPNALKRRMEATIDPTGTLAQGLTPSIDAGPAPVSPAPAVPTASPPETPHHPPAP